MSTATDYLTKQIIAYIGNKRKLLPLILKAVHNLEIEIKPGLKFFDVFAGSGVVSRLAKSLNFEVFSNDWEYYSFIINSAYVATNKSEIKDLFGSEDDFKNLLDKINSLPVPAEDEQYIAKYYAPKEFDINEVDYKTERLFYTRENALAIDKIRNYIEENFNDSNQKRKNLLLAELIYEAATHNNTSGVFKACHKEFGGHGKDALKRILGKIELHEPVLIDSDFPAHIFQQGANSLVKKMPRVDIAYLDPPYNQHQYGSNYHLLNTIAKWDKIPEPLDLNEKGVLKEKAGIRHDWIGTRSPYCYKGEAVSSFSDLIKNLNARFILISYSTDGIIPFSEMQKICMKKGKVSIVTNEYTTYRGGKQSNKRKNTNIEFILCIDTEKKSDEQDERNLDAIFLKRKSELLFKQKYSEQKLKATAESFTENSLTLELNHKELTIQTNDFFTLEKPENLDDLYSSELKILHEKLDSCVLETKEEELEEILQKIKKLSVSICVYPSSSVVPLRAQQGNDLAAASASVLNLAKLIPDTLKKLAHKKNKEIFYKCLAEVKNEEQKISAFYSAIHKKVDEVEKLAERRFSS